MLSKKANSSALLLLVISLMSFYLLFGLAGKILSDVGNSYALDSNVYNYTRDGSVRLQYFSILFPAIGLVILLFIVLYVLSRLFI